MINVFDIAEFILSKTGSVSAMKLQKLIYYCQAWSLVWDDNKLFNEPIEAWASGPVVRPLYEAHRGRFIVNTHDFKKFVSGEKLSDTQIETINTVLESYSDKSAQWLSDQTHSEMPWQIARDGLSEGERSSKVISLDSMAEYYGSLQ
jgi:uncharacterized phage-associated protein